MIAAGIAYQASGDGPPVIGLHGIGGSATSFHHQRAGITDHRMIAWNMPGYGESSGTPSSFAALSERLAAFITELDLESAHLLGHSIGGMLAIEHALRQPAQVRSLTLIGTTPSFGGRDDSFKDAFLKARLAPLDAGWTMAEIAAKAAPQLVGIEASDACIDAMARNMARINEATWRDVLACLVTFDRRQDLSALSLPACVIAGGQDRNAPARTMRKMADSLPNAVYHEIAAAGHMIPEEAPIEVNTILRTFYDEVSR